MRVRINDNILLVAPLRPGEDLPAGAEVEVPDAIGRDWIARGWVAELKEPTGTATGTASE